MFLKLKKHSLKILLIIVKALSYVTIIVLYKIFFNIDSRINGESKRCTEWSVGDGRKGSPHAIKECIRSRQMMIKMMGVLSRQPTHAT